MYLSQEQRETLPRELPLRSLRLVDQATAKLLDLSDRLERAPATAEAQILLLAEIMTLGQNLYRSAREYSRLWWRLMPDAEPEVA